jgi:PDZ domain/GAF domain
MRLAFQALIAALVLLGLIEAVAAQLATNDTGYFGISLSHYDPSGTIVASVTPGSPAAAAGIRAGDRIVIVPTTTNTIVMNQFTEPGDVGLVQDGARTITMRAAVAPDSAPIALVVILDAAKVAFFAMAVLVAWRKPDDPAARALALFLACFGFGLGFDFGLFHPPWLRLFFGMLVQTLFYLGAVAALAFACRFPTAPERGFRATINRLIWPLAAFGTVIGEGAILFGYLAPASTQNLRTLLPIPFLACYIVVVVAIVAAFWNSYRSSTGSDRVRIRWVLLTFAFGFSGLLVLFVGIILHGNTGVLPYAAFTTFVIPFGLAYVILRHRVLDIGFVINRAVVYAGVSVIVVVTFIIFEWLVGHVVETNSRTSAILQLGAALVLGLSIRPIHNRVDRWVDDLFFRERHAAEAAVRKFAHEALLITAQSDLIAKTVEVAQRNMRLSGCAFYTARDGRYVPLQSTFDIGPSVSENDYAVLGMRTWHTPVELHDVETQLPGELALPMTVRGKLAGFLLCGDKSSHEAFAPDEREALALLARDAGIALDSLRISALERAAGETGGGAVAL